MIAKLAPQRFSCSDLQERTAKMIFKGSDLSRRVKNNHVHHDIWLYYLHAITIKLVFSEKKNTINKIGTRAGFFHKSGLTVIPEFT